MSYSIRLVGSREVCPTCGRRDGDGSEPDCPDPTYNLTPIFDLALTGEPLPSPDVAEGGVVLFGQKTARPRGLRILDGRIAGDTVEGLERAVKRLNDPDRRDEFIALQPKNGWGDLPRRALSAVTKSTPPTTIEPQKDGKP